jgi:membrane protease YdiL (CAAX protease family)
VSEPATSESPSERAPGGGARGWKRHAEVVAVLLVIFAWPVLENLRHLGDPPSHRALEHPGSPWWLLNGIPWEIGMAVLLLRLIAVRPGPVPPRPTPRSEWRRELLLGLALGFGLLFATFAIGFVVLRLGVPGGATEWAAFLKGADARFAFSIETIVSSTYEEVAFRVYLQSRLEEWMPRNGLLAVVVSAGAFALIHGYSPAGSLDVYAFGLLQGLAWRRWRRLPRLVVAHAFSNILRAWL